MDCSYLLVLVILVALAQVLQAVSVKQALQTHSISDLAPKTQQISRNEVLSLPGYAGDLPSKHYAGYITVSEAHGRRLFYYLVTSESEQPHADPLIIWLTGGPGCSSLDAFTYENGPFKFEFKQGTSASAATLDDIVLTPNPFSWSKTANVLYIDSPAGTGMSYSEITSDYTTDDDRTSDDLEYFVERFFEEYPELRDLELYLAGESYGGVYVPLLAQKLLQHNQRLAAAAANNGSSSSSAADSSSSSSSSFEEGCNLQGYIVGNAVTDDEADGNGQIEFAYGMGLIDPITYNHAHRTCKGNFWNAKSGTACGNALDRIEEVMGPINQYDILGTCFHQEPQQSQNSQIYHQRAAQRRLLQQARRVWPHAAIFPHNTPLTNWYSELKRLSAPSAAAATAAAHDGSSSTKLDHTIDCADRRHALVYYNHPDVRRAIHAASIEEAGRWEPCSDVLHYTHTAGSMIPVHRDLITSGIRGLVLSGDHDYVVPFTSSREWVYGLRFRERNPWHAWSVPGHEQVAGYAVEFEDGLTFATVKGGGHMVPQTKPREALALLESWLDRRL